MKLRIARKIYYRLGYGYPIDNISRIETAVVEYNRRCRKSLREWKRRVTKKKH